MWCHAGHHLRHCLRLSLERHVCCFDWSHNLIFSSNHVSVYIFGNDSTLRVWEVAGACLHVLQGHASFVYRCARIPHFDWLVSVSDLIGGQRELCRGGSGVLEWRGWVCGAVEHTRQHTASLPPSPLPLRLAGQHPRKRRCACNLIDFIPF